MFKDHMYCPTRPAAKIYLPFTAFMLCTSLAIADVDEHRVSPNWLFTALPDSQLVADFVTKKLLPQLIGSDDKLRTRLGFSSLSQISALVLPDPPFAVFRIGLSRLKTYDPALSPFKVFLEDENWFENIPPTFVPARYLFPIREPFRPPTGCQSLIDFPLLGCVASSVQVKLLAGSWEFQQIGRPGLIKKLSHFGNGATHFVVWIPIFNLHYLARLDLSGPMADLKIKAINNDRYITHLTGKPFLAGEELPAKEVFMQLKALALPIPTNAPPG